MNLNRDPAPRTRTGRVLDWIERFCIGVVRLVAEVVLQRPTGRF